jgi:hypothetical protein
MSQNERLTKAVTNEVHEMINRSSNDRASFFRLVISVEFWR